MSRTFSANSGSAESLKVSARCGCKPNARQTRPTVDTDRPVALAIVRKDLKVALQNKGVVLPIVILPLILFVAFPWIMAYASSLTGMSGASMSNLDELLKRMPAGLLNELSPYTQEQQLIVFPWSICWRLCS